jgi:hypothetical protein
MPGVANFASNVSCLEDSDQEDHGWKLAQEKFLGTPITTKKLHMLAHTAILAMQEA